MALNDSQPGKTERLICCVGALVAEVVDGRMLNKRRWQLVLV